MIAIERVFQIVERTQIRPVRGRGAAEGRDNDGDNLLDLWTIQSITDTEGKGDTIIVKVPFKKK